MFEELCSDLFAKTIGITKDNMRSCLLNITVTYYQQISCKTQLILNEIYCYYIWESFFKHMFVDKNFSMSNNQVLVHLAGKACSLRWTIGVCFQLRFM